MIREPRRTIKEAGKAYGKSFASSLVKPIWEIITDMSSGITVNKYTSVTTPNNDIRYT